MKYSVQAPSYCYDVTPKQTTVFLAGSIEQGVADQWQDRVINKTEVGAKHRVLFFNPRRDDYDATQTQSVHNPYFKEQVEWELDHLTWANLIFMYFDPTTKSPISLLELGLCAKTKPMIICCPKGFWRRGNIEVMCDYFSQPLYETLEDGILALSQRLL